MSSKFGALLLFAMMSPAVAMTPAGTVIRGQATALVAGERYFSNEVESVVAAVCGVSLLPGGSPSQPGQRAVILPEGHAYLPYLISNTGNATFRYPIGVIEAGSGAWSPLRATFYLDENRNGRLDVNEPSVTDITIAQEENRHLVLEVVAPPTALGTTFLSAATYCPDGTGDRDNYARVDVTAGPVLAIEGSALPASAPPGAKLTLETILTNNGGQAAESQVVLSDLLDELRLADIHYIAGSATVSSGHLEYSDGRGWSEREPAEVHGVRVVVPRLAQDQQVRLSLDVRIGPGAAPGPRSSVLQAHGPGGPAQALALFEVLPLREHYLGPPDNPTAWPGGESSEDDLQSIPYLLAGQPQCLDLALINPGTSSDLYTLTPGRLPPGVAVSFLTTAGTQLGQPVPLGVGERLLFSYCLTAPPEGEVAAANVFQQREQGADLPPGALTSGFFTEVHATSVKTGELNRTRLRVGPLLGDPEVRLTLTATPARYLDLGSDLSYRLEVTNDSLVELSDAALRFPLPVFRPAVELAPRFLAAGDGGALASDGRHVRWSIPRLAVGESFSTWLNLRMPGGGHEGRSFALSGSFTLTSNEISSPRLSNELVHVFPSQSLLLDSEASPTEVRIGDAVRFRLTLHNPTAQTITPRLLVRTPEGLRYLPGSALVRLGSAESLALEPVEAEAPFGDARQAERALAPAHAAASGPSAGNLQWEFSSLPEMRLGPAGSAGDRLTLTFEALLLPGAGPALMQYSQGMGTTTVEGFTIGFASNIARSSFAVSDDVFGAAKGQLTGRVYLDRDGDSRFSPASDTPLAGARLLLANGWQAISDEQGLYAFRELEVGPWALLLDRHSAPFEPREAPGALQNGYGRLVSVAGVTVADFPLQPPTASASVTRTTSLAFGPLTLEKRHEATPEGVRVVMTLRSSEPLQGLQVIDPLPGGGEAVFEFERFDGETVLVHELPAGAAFTDPEVSWKDPYR